MINTNVWLWQEWPYGHGTGTFNGNLGHIKQTMIDAAYRAAYRQGCINFENACKDQSAINNGTNWLKMSSQQFNNDPRVRALFG